MMKRTGTAMTATGPIAAISVLLALVPVSAMAQSGGNPWNPYRTPRAQAAPAPVTQAAPVYAAPAPVPPMPNAPQSRPPSRFAPPGLEQQLAASAQRPAPPPPVAATRPTPPAPGGYGAPTGYARQGYGATPYPPARSYGGYPQAYGGYPRGYPGYGLSGYGPNSPFPGYGYPGGPGGAGPFSGNFTNGGVPAFNFMPFGLF